MNWFGTVVASAEVDASVTRPLLTASVIRLTAASRRPLFLMFTFVPDSLFRGRGTAGAALRQRMGSSLSVGASSATSAACVTFVCVVQPQPLKRFQADTKTGREPNGGLGCRYGRPRSETQKALRRRSRRAKPDPLGLTVPTESVAPRTPRGRRAVRATGVNGATCGGRNQVIGNGNLTAVVSHRAHGYLDVVS